MNKKNLEIYSKGIHIEELTLEESKRVLEEYYKIKYLEVMPQEKCENLEDIYNLALNTVLQNGYCLPMARLGGDTINPKLYFQDMLMLLYIYTINKNDKISANELKVSPKTVTYLHYSEQSGFGNILGFRRENKEKANDSEPQQERKKANSNMDINCNKQIQYLSTVSEEFLEKVLDGTIENDDSLYDKYKVEKIETKNKYNIPYICQDIVTALLKSREHNFFVILLEQNESFSTEDIQKLLDDKTSGDLWCGIPLQIFTEEVQKAFIKCIIRGGRVQKKDYKHRYDKDVNYNNEFKFYKKYFFELEKAENAREYDTKEELNEEEKKQRKLANAYLTEIIFAYSYYEYALTCLQNNSDKKVDKIFNKFMNVVYQVSESPLCYSRKEHIKQYWSRLKPFISSDNNWSEKELKKRMEKMIKIEKYAIIRFFPALFYCFLYYYIEIIEATKKDYRIENYMFLEKESICTRLDGRSFHKLFENSCMKYLWLKRGQKYLKPLVYDIGRALF